MVCFHFLLNCIKTDCIDILQECLHSYTTTEYKNTQISKSYNFPTYNMNNVKRLDVLKSIKVINDQLEEEIKNFKT